LGWNPITEQQAITRTATDENHGEKRVMAAPPFGITS
jgi:hypothetical protein